MPGRLCIRWSVAPRESASLTEALHRLMLTTRSGAGCLDCHLHTRINQRAALDYVEEWESEEALKRRLRSHEFTLLAELIERSTKPPQVEFTLPTGVRGLDYAEQVRMEEGTSAASEPRADLQ